MSLLFDQNLSPKLVQSLKDLFSGALHVRDLDLQRADDIEVWRNAADRGLTIVSKDSDFHQMSLYHGPPPKVIWIRRGNCSTSMIEDLLRENHEEIGRFLENPEAAFLSLG
ncbi:MAG: DUF5615 family PIN-like protein [Candidatus Omnitrophica bacterium]|nr:DUF5615 family PIN-like protein [Candidatus Omnitrophota bacterium]MCA9444626.1 DUF5615 family PIN-like protein [Candidatus Omnitrophota bacterium]